MKKPIILAALALCGCGADVSDVGPSNTAKWTDPETGCVYLFYKENARTNFATGSLSIRYLETGLPDCPGTRVSLESPL